MTEDPDLKSIVLQRWLPILGIEYIGQESLFGFSELVSALQHYLRTGILVLEIGCGRGAMACHLAEIAQIEIIGIDNNPYCIEMAQKLASQKGLNQRVLFSVAQMDTLDLKAIKRKVGLIYSVDVLQNSLNISQCFQSIASHLKVPGYLYATMWCFDQHLAQLALDWGFSKVHSVDQIREACRLAGFVIIEFQDAGEIFVNRCRASLASWQALKHVLRGKIGNRGYEERLYLEKRTVEAVESGFLRQIRIELKLLVPL